MRRASRRAAAGWHHSAGSGSRRDGPRRLPHSRRARHSGGSTSSPRRAGVARGPPTGRRGRSGRCRTAPPRRCQRGVVGVHEHARRVGQALQRCEPALGDELELAVAVELVAEQVAKTHRSGASRRTSSGSAPSSTSKRPSSASSASSNAEATPETRFAPAALWASRARGRRISAAIAVVVVFPFVAETRATPSGSERASRPTAAGSSAARSFPGSVVPPPRPVTRDSLPAPRASAVSIRRRTRPV